MVELKDVPSILNVLGGVIEIYGVYLMANRYAHFVRRNYIPLIFSSVINGEMLKNAAIIADNAKEKSILTIRGLSFISIGFAVQIIANVINIIFI